MIHNLLVSAVILLILLVSSFAMYLPLSVIVRNRSVSARYAIPFSISAEIIIGYFFYCTNTVRSFPFFYLVIVLLVNAWAYLKLRPLAIKIPRANLMTAVVLIISAVIIYTRYYDGFKFIGPGGNDTYYHLLFVKDLITIGRLPNGFYAPGFHLFLMPLAEIISYNDLYRFSGPAIGVISVLSFVLLIRDYLKNKILLIVLLTLLVLPIFNQFTLQTIYFFSSAMTFIYFSTFICLLSDKDINQKKIDLGLTVIFSTALALTVPLLFVVILPASLIIFLTVLACKKRFANGYLLHLFNMNLILLLGIIISFGHVLIQSKLLSRYYGFPSIAMTVSQPKVDTAASSEVTSEVITSNDELASKLTLPKFVSSNPYLKPMAGTAYDLTKIKNIRPASGILGLGAYAWIIFSFFLLSYAIRKKNSPLLVVAVLSIFFGLSTQTGLFEMSYYRGRSGWYLLMLSIFGIVFFADQVYSKKLSKYLPIGCILLSATGFFWPPVFYRSYYDEEFKAVKKIASQFSGKQISLIADNRQLNIVADNITVSELKPENLGSNNAFLIIEKKIFFPNPTLSQTATSTDKNLTMFNKQLATKSELLKDRNSLIESDEKFKKFSNFFENEDFIIYKSTE